MATSHSIKSVVDQQVQTILPTIQKGSSLTQNSNKFQSLQLINNNKINDHLQGQNSTKNITSQSQKQLLKIQEQEKHHKGSYSHQNSLQDEMSKHNNNMNFKSKDYFDTDNPNSSIQSNSYHQDYKEEEDEKFDILQENQKESKIKRIKHQKGSHSHAGSNLQNKQERYNQMKQQFIPYKYRQDINTSSNMSSFQQFNNHNNYGNSNNYYQYNSQSHRTDSVVCNSDEEVNISKEEFRDPILNVEKHKKEFGVNIAQKMNRFYNIKALTNKSKQLQVAFDNANNLYIVDQREENYLPQTTMNTNLGLSMRKQYSQTILSRIIQNQQNLVNQSEGLSSSIITNGKESSLSQIAKKSPFNYPLLSSNTNSNTNTIQSFFPNSIMNNYHSPKSNTGTLNSPTSLNQLVNQQNINQKKFNNGFSSVINNQNNNNNMYSSQRNSLPSQIGYLSSPTSQFDKYTTKKATIPLVDTRKALFKYYNKRNCILSTEAQLGNTKDYQKYHSEFIKSQGQVTANQRSREDSPQQYVEQSQNQQKGVKSTLKTVGSHPLNASLSTNNSKRNLFNFTQPNEQNFGLTETLKTWKVSKFNDDFNRIPKEDKKSYYRGQLNNKYDSKYQTAYFIANGKYGFCSSTTEGANDSQCKNDTQDVEYQKSEDQIDLIIEPYQQQQQYNIGNNNNNNSNNYNIQDQQYNTRSPEYAQHRNLKELFELNSENMQTNQPQQIEQQKYQPKIQISLEKDNNKKDNPLQKQPNEENINDNNSNNKREVSTSTIQISLQNKQLAQQQDLEKNQSKRNNEIINRNKKGSNTARESYQNDLENEELTGWVSRKKSETFYNHISSKPLIEYKKKSQSFKNQPPTNSNIQLDQLRNSYIPQNKVTSPNSQNLASSFQSIPKSPQSNNSISNSAQSINGNGGNSVRDSNPQKDPNKISQISEHGESQDYSLDNSHINQLKVTGFHNKDKYDDDEDLKNYLHLQNIIPSQIK